MQEKIVLVGQNDCYGVGSEMLSNLLSVEVNSMQLHRVTNTYGNLLEDEKVLNVHAIEEDSLGINKEECVYAMVDGSMLFTREEKWKEVKVGRVFKESDCMEIGGERGWIKSSLYETYLGKSNVFTNRMDRTLSPYITIDNRLIFVCDGARWIWKWISEAYPKAVQILDWYHAIEHLNDFAKSYFKDEKQRKKWIENQKEELHESNIDKVLKTISSLECKTKNRKESQRQLLQYYRENKCRMDYKRYREIGTGTFSSGPIESAHREVIQKRMKLSGQMWTKRGAQNMLTLRSTHLYKIYFYITQIICIFPQKKMGRSTRKISGYSSSEIKALFKTEDKYKIRIRLYAVYQISLGKPSRELEVLYNTSFKQILNWASRFEKEGIEGLRDKKGRGRKSKLTDAQKEQLKEVVLKKSPENYGYNTSTWNGPLLIDWLNKHMGVFYQRAQIYNVLKSLGLTYQKSKGFYPEADKEKQSIFKETLKKNFLNLL